MKKLYEKPFEDLKIQLNEKNYQQQVTNENSLKDYHFWIISLIESWAGILGRKFWAPKMIENSRSWSEENITGML